MDRRQGAYFINVSFNQIVIFLFAVVIISFITFILGYRSGKNSARKAIWDSNLVTTNQEGDYQELNFKNEKKHDIKDELAASSITEDLTPKNQIKKEVTKGKDSSFKPDRNMTSRDETEDSIYYYIQVGAFSLLENAQKYTQKFKKLGYFTQISPIKVKDKQYYRVQVGRFNNKGEAKIIKRKLEKQEGKKFSLKLSN